MLNNKKRIFICGPSGVGKTTLAKELSKTMGIPFIESSASSVWPQFGFTSHSDALSKIAGNPELGFDYQMAILDNRLETLKDLPEFITDRTPFDTMVYFMLQNSSFTDPIKCEVYKQRCKDLTILSNTLIFIPFGDHIILEDNGKRINSRMFQETTSAIFTYILREDYLGVFKKEEGNYNVFVLHYWDFAQRMYETMKFLQAPNVMANKWML